MDTGPDRQSMSLFTGGICKIRTAVRYHSRFFVQDAHKITYESSESKYFFTILYPNIVKSIKIINRADKNWANFLKIKY